MPLDLSTAAMTAAVTSAGQKVVTERLRNNSTAWHGTTQGVQAGPKSALPLSDTSARQLVGSAIGQPWYYAL